VADKRARYEEALRQGHSHSWEQRWPDAIAEFEMAIEAVVDEPAAYAGLGMAYVEMGEFEQALEYYKLAARYSRGDMIYLKHVADVQERLGMLTEAGQTYMALGEIQLRRKRLDEAVGNWLRAASLDPDLLGAHQRLAAVYRRQGLVSNAIREYLAMARIYHSRGGTERALKMCGLALELDPRNADALTAMDLIRRGEEIVLDEQEQMSLDSLDLANASSDVVQRMASALELEPVDWQSSQEADGGVVESALNTARQQLAQEIFSEEHGGELENDAGHALSQLERDALISQALDFETREMTDEAIDCFERAIRGGATSAAAHFCLGVLYREKLRIKQAIGEFTATQKDLTYRPASHYAIGESYQLRGDMNRALGHYIVALKYIDLTTIDTENAWRVNEQYDYFAKELLSEVNSDKASSFIEGLTEFLSRPGWQERVKKARKRLDNLAPTGETMILGEFLTAGSLSVLESLHLSQEYAQQGKYDSAVEEAYRAIQLSPHYLAGHIQLAELMVKQERTQIAVTKYLNIGDTYRVRGDANGAIGNYERAVELSPMDLSNRARLIEILIQQDYIDRALDHYLVMGEAYYNLAEVEKARETYLEALRLAPKGSADRNWRSRLLRAIADIDMQRLDWKRALAAYNELITSDPEDDRVVITLVDLYYKVGQPSSALRQLDRYLVRIVRNGQGERVESILEDLVDQHPADAGLADRLTRLYIRQGREEEAVKLLDNLGEAQIDVGEDQKAMKTLQRILQLNPPNATSYRQLLQRLRQSATS
jgi:tetratricopeptide (TPR) repeat protein